MRDWAKLHADISKSRSFAAVCNEKPEAGLVFLMMLPRADILGIVDAHPVVFRGEVCPLLNLSEDEVEECLQVLYRHDMLCLYHDDHGDRWGWVRNWHKFQDVRWDRVGPTIRPLPECWESPDGLGEFMQENSGNKFVVSTESLLSRRCTTPGPLQDNSGSAPETMPGTLPDQRTEVERRGGEERTESRGEERTEVSAADDAAPGDKPAKRERKETERQTLIRDLYEAWTGQPLPNGSINGYQEAHKVAKRFGTRSRQWLDYLRQNGGDLTETDEPWEAFCTAYREAMNQPWNWNRKPTTNYQTGQVVQARKDRDRPEDEF